jgi:serine acetyltransferase
MTDHTGTMSALLFAYEGLSREAFEALARLLPLKLIRWLVAHHPDNRCRKRLLRLSNVACGSGAVINGGFVVSDDYEPLLTIGDRVAISPNVTVVCTSAPNNSRLADLPGFTTNYVKAEPVHLDSDCWIGSGAIILPGVTIGRMAVVGAGSVVTRSVPEGAVVVGAPARQVKQLPLEP